MRIHPPTNPLTHSPSHPLTHSPTHPLTHSPTHHSHPLTHTQAKAAEHLPLQTAVRVARAVDPVLMLQHISQNFPGLAASLAATSVPKAFRTEVAKNQKLLQDRGILPGTSALIVNNVYTDVTSNTNLFSLIKVCMVLVIVCACVCVCVRVCACVCVCACCCLAKWEPGCCFDASTLCCVCCVLPVCLSVCHSVSDRCCRARARRLAPFSGSVFLMTLHTKSTISCTAVLRLH